MINVEPRLAEVTRVTATLPNLPDAFDGLTLVQTSDWHMGEWMTLDKMLSIAQQINALKPDMILHTGDYVGRALKNVLSDVTQSLQAFEAREGIYGTLGNHDYHHVKAADVVNAVERAGNTQMLRNAHARIQRGDSVLYIAGVDDIWENKQNLNQALDGIPVNSTVILLAHEPDFADVVSTSGRVSLQLSGHTHGGQFRLPITGALVLPRYGQKYDMGLYNIGDMVLYVNRGLGMIPPYVRFNCPAEITHFTLRTSV